MSNALKKIGAYLINFSPKNLASQTEISSEKGAGSGKCPRLKNLFPDIHTRKRRLKVSPLNPVQHRQAVRRSAMTRAGRVRILDWDGTRPSARRAWNRLGRPHRPHRAKFISQEVDLGACLHGVALDFSRPGKTTDNAFIVSYFSGFRQEYLKEKWFLSLKEAKENI